MKRYRVITADFDGRAALLEPVQDHWEQRVKELHRQNQKKIIAELRAEYGDVGFDEKLENFKALGVKPFSVVAYHNRFLSQIRKAFTFCQYYPALTAACALGERVLNHLILGLRDSYKDHLLYKTVYRKKSFDNWPFAIQVLAEWGVLTDDAITAFRQLNQKRNEALHFNRAVDLNDKEFSLFAIKNLEDIIRYQFSGFGLQPWLLPSEGECFIKKEYEDFPFVKLIYLPNCVYLGYEHVVTSVLPWGFRDADKYPDYPVSDEEFLRLRKKFRDEQVKKSRA